MIHEFPSPQYVQTRPSLQRPALGLFLEAYHASCCCPYATLIKSSDHHHTVPHHGHQPPLPPATAAAATLPPPADVVLEPQGLLLLREHLFEKPLTPSDVGKLNRLVIPKQHAEKYFPIDNESGDNGIILSFEDECGKMWSFRYSYWTSSQSYVLTKGWSRYIKDKRLDAGDVVLFERHRSDADRLYIGWRQKGEASAAAAIGAQNQMPLQCNPAAYEAWPPFVPRRCAVEPDCVPTSNGDIVVPSQAAASNSKKLRLSGVNMEYGLVPGSPSSDDQQPQELQFLPLLY